VTRGRELGVVQVVDGGRGGALKVAQAIAGIPARRHELVLTGLQVRARSRRELVTHLARVLRSAGRPRILLAHRDWLACRLAGLVTRTPVVFVSHGRGPVPAPRAKRLGLALAYRRQRFVTVGIDAQAVLRETLGLDSTVIANGVEIPGFVAPAAAAPLRLLYLGRFEGGQKRPDIPVRVTALLAGRGIDVETTMLGDGGLRGALEDLARSLGVESRVRFPGWADDPRPHVEAAHALVMSTWWEGNSLGVLEALAAGRAAVVSRVPGTRALAGTPGVTLVDAGEDPAQAAERFADALVELRAVAAGPGAEAHFRAIHDHARAELSAERMVAAWHDFLAAAEARP
jgi:glycosyltransferase involved in cell wall biosynthesis